MNLSTFITRIKMKLGIYTIALPIDVDEFITTVINDISIPVFSVYCPLYEKITFDMSNLQSVAKGPNYETFLLPDFKTRKLKFVEDVDYATTGTSSSGYGALGAYNDMFMNGNAIESLILSSATQNIMSQTMPKLSFKYKHPRELTVFYAYFSNYITVNLAFEHDRNLMSIPPTAEESFFKLVILDVQENLYSTVKHYNEIESAYGRVSLKIDDWERAEENRKALIDDWDGVYHMDLPTQIVYK